MAKRMSADEKRKVILEIYHKSKSVYVEKEILTLAAKAGVNANTVADINQGLIDDGLVDKEKVGGTNYFWSFPAKKDRLDQIQHDKVLAQIVALKTNIADAEVELKDAKRGREENDEEGVESTTTDVTNKEDGSTATKENESNEKEDTGKPDEPSGEGDGPPPAKKQCVTMSTTTTTTTTTTRAAKLQRLDEIAKQRAAALAELETLKENDPQALADLEKELQLVQQAANRWTDNMFNCQNYLIKKRGMEKKEAFKLLGITSTFDYPDDKIPK